MATIVHNAQTGTTSQPKTDQIVYALDRNGQYKHTMHRVRRVDFTGDAVTYCTTWLRYGAVESSNQDCAVWCENGCKPPMPVSERPEVDYYALMATQMLQRSAGSVMQPAPTITVQDNVITISYASGKVLKLTASME